MHATRIGHGHCGDAFHVAMADEAADHHRLRGRLDHDGTLGGPGHGGDGALVMQRLQFHARSFHPDGHVAPVGRRTILVVAQRERMRSSLQLRIGEGASLRSGVHDHRRAVDRERTTTDGGATCRGVGADPAEGELEAVASGRRHGEHAVVHDGKLVRHAGGFGGDCGGITFAHRGVCRDERRAHGVALEHMVAETGERHCAAVPLVPDVPHGNRTAIALQHERPRGALIVEGGAACRPRDLDVLV